VVVIADAAYYASIIEDVQARLAGLDTTGYRWDTSDGWAQARHPADIITAPEHLRAWFALGQAATFVRTHIEHSAVLVFAARYQADDDAISQARAHAAARAAADMLNGWSLPGGERLLPKAWTIEPAQNDFLTVTLTASLLLPRGS
jgi:hypothetical protein